MDSMNKLELEMVKDTLFHLYSYFESECKVYRRQARKPNPEFSQL